MQENQFENRTFWLLALWILGRKRGTTMSLASEYSPLIQAILANDEDALQAALDADPASANERDRLGHTPLYYVVVQDFSEALPALLAAGADPAAEPRRDQVYSMMPGVRSLQSGGGSLLHSCAEHRTPELCAALATELRVRGVVSSASPTFPAPQSVARTLQP